MRTLRTLLPALLLTLVFWALLSHTAHAQDPDYSDTPDILHGQKFLLRTDDIVLVQANQPIPPNPPVESDVYLYPMLTANGAITTVEAITSTVTMTQAGFSRAMTAVGRMFDLPHDVVAVLAMDEAGPPNAIPLNLTVRDLQSGKSVTQQVGLVDYAGTNTLALEMADFTGDGYDDIAVSYSTAENTGTSVIHIIQAADPLSFTAGLRMGPASLFPVVAAQFAAVHLGNQVAANLLLAGAVGPVVFHVDPTSLALTQQSALSIPGIARTIGIVAGDFDADVAGVGGSEEAVVFGYFTSTNSLSVVLIDFPPPQFAPVAVASADTGRNYTVAFAADKVHPLGSDGDAIAFGAGNEDANGNYTDNTLFLYTVENGQFVQQAALPQDYPPVSLAFGRFDGKTAAGAMDPNLQLVVLSVNYTNGTTAPTTSYLRTYNIGSGGSGYTPTLSSPATFTFGLPNGSVATGDLQGRSLKLGSPTKITIDAHSAPRTVVGMPPMHLDWVVPSCSDPNYPDNCSTPQIVNVLALPSTNWAQFNTEVKKSVQSSSTSSTGTSFSVMTDTAATVGYANPDLGSVSTEIKNQAKYTYDTAVNTDANSYSTFTFDTSVRTGFADHVWFDASRFNLWTYRVIGQTACPYTLPNCSSGQRLPLHLQFSGPDQINRYDLDGNVVEWYQPPWEPGNLLSYPWTAAQLLATLPRSVATNVSDVWAADSSGSNASVNWEGGTGQQFSSGTTQAFSSDGAFAASGSINISGFDLSGSVALDRDTGSSFATLGTNGNENGSSTGFNVSKSAQGVTDYVFVGQTYILGQNQITGTVTTPAITSTVQMTGALRLGYWANPFDPQFGGSWWPRTYVLPDVALNHPQRWTWSTSPTKGDIMTFNPASTTSSPYDQDFYYMRGLFVTSPNAPEGPQLTTGTVTETLLLQARVYNYSHFDMDSPALAQPAAHVKVRFYGQLFKSDEGQYPAGDSFLIGETTLAPIPGFASTTTPGDQHNWRMAAVTFDPLAFTQTKNGNVYLRFWVLTWMEDKDNHLVAEMAGHGLTADPASMTINTLSDVPVEPYSNNAGSFKQVFYIQDPDAVTAGGTQAAAAGPFTLTLAALQTVPPTPPLQAGPRGKYQITATVHNGGRDLPSAQLIFSDGDPAQGGKPFDWEFIPYVGAQTAFVSRVTYTPQACGDRTVYVTAIAGDQQATASLKVLNVQCAIVLPVINKGR